MASSTDTLRRLLAKDEHWLRFKEIVKKFSMSDQIETLMGEIDTLHLTRKTRKLYRNTPNPRDIVDAVLEDSSFRSRAVEIMMRMMRSQKAIEKAIDNICGYILSEYGDYIDAKTKAERDRVLRSVNQRAIQYLHELESSIEIIREFTTDVDKTGYAIKASIEGLNILYKRDVVVHSA